MRKSVKTILLLLAFVAAAAGSARWAAADTRVGVAPTVATMATLSGKVSADQGEVRAFRVKAHDLVNRVFYTVYTKAGEYRFHALPAGSYEVFVLPYEGAYDSPKTKVELAPGQSGKVDLALKARPARADTTQYLAWDEIYPEQPGKHELMVNCMGCHGRIFFHRMARDEAGWKASITKMTTGVGTWAGNRYVEIDPDTRDRITQYLVRNFGPAAPRRDVRMDERRLDEAALSTALWIEYEYNWEPFLPDTDDTPSGRAVYTSGHRLHDPYVSPVDGTIWYASSGNDTILQLDPREPGFRKRWRKWQINQGRLTFMHGIAVDRKGHVWWAEISGSRLGELDPATGSVTRHEIPHGGSMLQVALDSRDNVWYGLVHGSYIGRLDAATRRIQDWKMPIADTSPYGITIDADDNFWTVGWARHVVTKFDPRTNRFTEYFPSSIPAGTRRLGADAQGSIWFSMNSAEGIGLIEKGSDRIVEFRTPLRWSEPYETWPDNRGNVWATDSVYGSIIRFDAKAKRWGAYYPYPQADHWSVPKIEVAGDGTIWAGSRGVPNIVAVAFKPNGNVPRAIAPSGPSSPGTASAARRSP